jgi:hypothetical protein
VTVNSSCNIAIPVGAALQIEKGMGSVEVRNLANKIEIVKVLGSLIVSDVEEVLVSKVGGNFAVQNATGMVQVEKVGGNLVVDRVESFSCEKIGGNCTVRNVANEFALYKAGGSVKAQSIPGQMKVERIGGTFTGKDVMFASDLRVGGDIRLKGFDFSKSGLSLKAGGDISLEIAENFAGGTFTLQSGAEDIRIALTDHEQRIDHGSHQIQIGEAVSQYEAAAGGSIQIRSLANAADELIGDLSGSFVYEESPFSEMIRERIESATRLAEAKVKSAEIRLDKIRDRVEKSRGFNLLADFESREEGSHPIPAAAPVPPPAPVPSFIKPSHKKGASDEERLMILKMLQEKKITVDEAETLFKALEN